jgi:hypothetical protein
MLCLLHDGPHTASHMVSHTAGNTNLSQRQRGLHRCEAVQQKSVAG